MRCGGDKASTLYAVRRYTYILYMYIYVYCAGAARGFLSEGKIYQREGKSYLSNHLTEPVQWYMCVCVYAKERERKKRKHERM